MSPMTWTQPATLVVSSRRMDADHFQPSHSRLEEAIRKTGMAEQLGDLLEVCRRGVQPEYVPGGEVLVINSQHVGEHLINEDGAQRTSLDFWDAKPRARAQQLDVLLNATGVGTIGRANCVFHFEKTVVDNHVTVLRVKPGSIDPAYLSTFLNSTLGRSQTYKWQSGSSGQLELYPDDIKRFWVVLPDAKVQAEIAAALRGAYELSRQALTRSAEAEQRVVGLIEL